MSLLVVIAGIVVASTAEISQLGRALCLEISVHTCSPSKSP